MGITDLGWINKLTMAALFVLTLVLCKVIFFSGNAMDASGEAMTFGAAVELAVAMPSELAAPHQRLHPGGGKACAGHLGQRSGVRTGVLLDVCHRYGRGDLHRGV